MIGYESIQVYATLSGFPSGASHSHNIIYYSPCQQAPLKKGNSMMESCVLNNPAAPSPSQYGQFRVVQCPLPLEYQAASSQARLKSCWALPPWGYPLRFQRFGLARCKCNGFIKVMADLFSLVMSHYSVVYKFSEGDRHQERSTCYSSLSQSLKLHRQIVSKSDCFPRVYYSSSNFPQITLNF